MTVDDIRTVAVVGAGDMGHGIAEVALIAGYKVNLYDIKQEFVDRGEQRIYQSLDKLVSKNKVPADRYEEIKGELLKKTVDLTDAVKDADLVTEAAPEVLELKKQIFAEMDKAAPEHALLASNTSTMSITDIASATNRPEKVLGMHYFNPAVLMRLVEVIRGPGRVRVREQGQEGTGNRQEGRAGVYREPGERACRRTDHVHDRSWRGPT
jgi:enoyl-CoA hydratase/3-hydroxyacyl-CoA dehydrogenase